MGERPADGEEHVIVGALGELALDGGDQFVALAVHFVLGFKEGAALVVAGRFQATDALLGGELGLQGKGGDGFAAGFFNEAFEFFDLALQADLQVVGP